MYTNSATLLSLRTSGDFNLAFPWFSTYSRFFTFSHYGINQTLINGKSLNNGIHKGSVFAKPLFTKQSTVVLVNRALGQIECPLNCEDLSPYLSTDYHFTEMDVFKTSPEL